MGGYPHSMDENCRLYAISRRVTDEELGEGTYDRINGPLFKAAADAGDRQLAAEGES